MRKVLVVGSFDRLVSKYRKVAAKYNCKLYHHSGDCNGGESKLNRHVIKADVVFCTLDVNSHTARKLVKKNCQKLQKKAFFLTRSSVSEFKRALGQWLNKKEHDEGPYFAV